MRAAIFHGVGRPLTIETVADPQPAEDQVIIEVERSGICGSDLTLTGEPGYLPPGSILGHEYVGGIAEIGANVRGWKVGETVTALPIFPCRNCDACDAGLPSLCASVAWAGTVLERPGAYAEYVAAESHLLQRIPAGVGREEAAMVEPLTIAYHGVTRAEGIEGAAVLIHGGGPIGAGVAVFARMAGAAHVVVSEPVAERRERCMSLGATLAIDPIHEDIGRRFQASTGTRPNVTFECAGMPGLIRKSVQLSAFRGRIVAIAVAHDDDLLAPFEALKKEVSIAYSIGYVEQDYAAVIDAVARSAIDVRPMHTSTVGFDALPETFESLRSDRVECKVLIDPALGR